MTTAITRTPPERSSQSIPSSPRTVIDARMPRAEEFLILLPRTNCEGARVAAERIGTMIEKTTMSSGQGENFAITISLGVGERTDDDSVDTLVNKADRALYQAKANGRNRVKAL